MEEEFSLKVDGLRVPKVETKEDYWDRSSLGVLSEVESLRKRILEEELKLEKILNERKNKGKSRFELTLNAMTQKNEFVHQDWHQSNETRRIIRQLDSSSKEPAIKKVQFAETKKDEGEDFLNDVIEYRHKKGYT